MLANVSTSVSTEKTIGEVMGMLAAAGASSVETQYDTASRRPSGLRFTIATPYGVQRFAMPANTDGMYDALKRAHARREIRASHATRDQAERVAWRAIRQWLLAQLTMIEAGLVELGEIMMPWLEVEDGRTLYRASVEIKRPPMLPAPSSTIELGPRKG